MDGALEELKRDADVKEDDDDDDDDGEDVAAALPFPRRFPFAPAPAGFPVSDVSAEAGKVEDLDAVDEASADDFFLLSAEVLFVPLVPEAMRFVVSAEAGDGVEGVAEGEDRLRLFEMLGAGAVLAI